VIAKETIDTINKIPSGLGIQHTVRARGMARLVVSGIAVLGWKETPRKSKPSQLF